MKRLIVFGALFFAVTACPLFAQTDIELSCDTLYTPVYGGFTHFRFADVINMPYIKNVGLMTVDLGLSISCEFWHLDTVGLCGDTARFWARLDHTHSISFYTVDTLPQYALWTSPRFCSEGYYDTAGISLDPGDSLFFYLTFLMPCWEGVDTIRINVYGQNEYMADTELLVWECIPWGFPPDTPDTLKIDSLNVISDDERVYLSTINDPPLFCFDFYNVYRDTVPLFFMTQLDTTPPDNNKIGITASQYFTDDFSDTIWPHYSGASKGLGDILVNLFYVFTTVDTGASAPDGYSESSYPSQCVCEFDQPLYTHAVLGARNWISISNFDYRYRNASDLDSLGITQVMEWDAASQSPILVSLRIPGFGWVIDGPLKVGHVYNIIGTHGVTPPLFSTNTPGWIPYQCDSIFTLHYDPTLGGKNIIMLPFRASIVEGITDRMTLEMSIEEAGGAHDIYLMRIDRWDGSAFAWEPLAEFSPPSGWTANPPLRAGVPYRIWLISPYGACSFIWPLS